MDEDVLRRLEHLEAAVSALQQGAQGETAVLATGEVADPSGADFWVLDGIHQRLPAPGGVFFAGAVDVGLGHAEFQWGRTTGDILQADWAERAERLAALGHPLRLAMLRLLLGGERTVAQLVDELDLASTGVAYHHLNQLHNAGWATSPQRGLWSVPASRVVPLLAVVTAMEDA